MCPTAALVGVLREAGGRDGGRAPRREHLPGCHSCSTGTAVAATVGLDEFPCLRTAHGRAEGTSREELIHNLPLSLVDWSIHSWGQYAPFIAHCVTQDPPWQSVSYLEFWNLKITENSKWFCISFGSNNLIWGYSECLYITHNMTANFWLYLHMNFMFSLEKYLCV